MVSAGAVMRTVGHILKWWRAGGSAPLPPRQTREEYLQTTIDIMSKSLREECRAHGRLRQLYMSESAKVHALATIVEGVIADLKNIAELPDSTPDEAQELTDWSEELIAALAKVLAAKGDYS